MKTPKDIKTALDCHMGITISCFGCAYDADDVAGDAVDYIESLELHIRDLTKKVERLEAERDAAISEIGRDCETCKHYEACHSPVFCDECGYYGGDRYVCCTCEDLDKWEWHGVCAENGGDGIAQSK